MRILVCNRGEIACRIIDTVKKSGHEAIAIYSKEDKECLHVKKADYAVCIGEKDASSSYLNIANILIVATTFGVDAIHPGYGFLSENSDFAKLVEELNIQFIGPSSENIQLMGDKINALKTVKSATKYFDDQLFYEFSNLKELLSFDIKYPIILKYANGGGGRGIAKVFSSNELVNAYNKIFIEASQMDNNPRFYMEKFITDAKHIEVQILGDKDGNIIHLDTRDCSIQRRVQKIIEEAPAMINKDIKNKLLKASLEIARYINYQSLVTFEFLVKDNEVFFLEMNTRIQVEHSVTEQITNLDLVALQISIASNEKLKMRQKDVKVKGHAIELRINAEDPYNNFNPCPGQITKLELPSNKYTRYDFGYQNLDYVNLYFDSMIGKIIITDKNRDKVVDKFLKLLEEVQVGNIKTNIYYAKKLMQKDEFKSNSCTINFVKD